MLNPKKLSKLGIGTWGIGGFDKRDPHNNDQRQIEAMTYMFDHGINFFETTIWYSEGWAAQLVAEALSKSNKKREDIFISQAIYPYDLETLSNAHKEVEVFAKRFHTTYVDTVLFTGGGIAKYGLAESIQFFQDNLKKGKTRFVSITNTSLEVLQTMHKAFGSKLFSQEIHFSFEVRDIEDAGLVEYASKNRILNIIYQPLRRNRTAPHNWPLLVELSKKYKKTQNQILIQWLIARGFLPLVKSETIDHIKENLAALDFQLEKEDVERLNRFRVPNYKPPVIDWGRQGSGTPPHMLPNVFDEEYAKQQKK